MNFRPDGVFSTIKNADEIAVVRHGEILEKGTRDELLLKNGEYAALERAQGLS